MSDNLTIRGLIERIISGTIRIPKFQRGFVWEPKNVAFLMDSIYRGYPFGSVLFWRTEDKLTGERDLGPFTLPEPAKKWPIDYVLDGQQRITSLFGVFQTTLIPNDNGDAFEVYFDLGAKEGALEDQFIAKSFQSDADVPATYFPLRLIFDAGSFALRTQTMTPEHLTRVVELQRRFQEAQIKHEVIEFDNREQIAMIFERINRAGIPLDTFQLLTAWTWSDQFDLNERIESLGEDVAPYGYSRIGEAQDLLLKCAAAVISGDASIKAIVALHGPTVRDKFETVTRGLFGAIEFLRTELKVHSLEILPYPAMLVPLSRFFATETVSGFHPTARQRKVLKQWFWWCCFTRRYSSGVNSAHATDIAWVDALKDDEKATVPWAGTPVLVMDPAFHRADFNIGSVATKIFILQLAQRSPRSLLSNAKIDLKEVLLRCNRNEFHHIFPKAYLTRTYDIGLPVNAIANFCFLSSSDNQKIKDKKPSDYVSMIKPDHRENIYERAMLYENWHKDSYYAFLSKRMNALVSDAARLCGLIRQRLYWPEDRDDFPKKAAE